MARPLPEADTQSSPDKGRDGAFGAVLRKMSDAPAATSAADDRDDAAEAGGAAAKSDPEGATATAAPPPADPASDAATTLANILNAALPAAGPSAGSGAPSASQGAADVTSTGGSPGAAPTASDAAKLSGRALARAAGSPQGLRTGPGSFTAPAITVLDRAVHFKPVRPQAAPPNLAPADPATGATAAAAVARPQPVQPGLPGMVAIAASKLPAPIRLEPPCSADTAVLAAAAGPDKPDMGALEDSRAVPGITRTILTGAGHQNQASGSALASGDSAVTKMGLPAITLPTIAAAIEDEIARASASGPDPAGNHADPVVRAAPDGPMRVLRIQLRPEELGTVTVELRLANGQLETHLRASRPETAALLHRDAALLTDLLKQANYQAEVTVGQARPADAGGSPGGTPSQGQPSFANGGARPDHEGNRERQAQHRPAGGNREGERMDETVRPRDGGIYL
ncbi:flagellar hook-length control protein FliK [Methylobacterium sp. CM6257]